MLRSNYLGVEAKNIHFSKTARNLGNYGVFYFAVAFVSSQLSMTLDRQQRAFSLRVAKAARIAK
jgi:hypothetical protein